MDVRDIPLTANVPARQPIPFRFFMLIEAPAAIEVRFLARDSLSKIGEIGRAVEAGYKKFPLDPSNELERWGGYELISTSNQTVRVGVSDSAGDYARLVQLFQLQLSTSLTATADVTNIGEAAPVQVLAANAARKAAHVSALAGNDDPLRIGGANVTATRGQPLVPGLTLTLHTTGAIYAIRESGSGADQGVALLEET